MIFRQLFDKESSTYTYLLADETTGRALLIDPVIEQVEAYQTLLEQLGLELALALDTHTHADHITALGRLRELTGCRALVGEQSQADCASGYFADGERIELDGITLIALYTPGHTDDSYTFLLEKGGEPRVFTGDTLLIRGTGRTDFQNGNARDQYRSLFDKLLTLPPDTWVYPGHDYKGWTVSTVDEERENNPRLQVKDIEEYAELMGSLNLPNPKMMDVAVPANQACGQR